MRKNSKSAWTQDDEKYLIDNYKQTPYAELAEKLGRSKQAVTARISLLGLDTKRNLIGMYHDRIIKLARDSDSYADIARALDVDISPLSQYMRKHNIGLQQKPVSVGKLAILNGIEDPIKLNGKNVTFKNYFIYWYQTYRREHVSQVTKNKYRLVFGRVCSQPIADEFIGNIDRGTAQEHMNWFGKDHSKNTVYDHWQFLRSCFSDAVSDGYAKMNPFENIRPIFKEQQHTVAQLKEKRDEKRWLEVEEYSKFKYWLTFGLQGAYNEPPIIGTSGKRNETGAGLVHQVAHTAIFIGLKTGARFGEILGLTREDILVDTNEINIDKTWDYKYKQTFQKTKNIASIRKVPVDRETIDILFRYMRWLDQFELETDQGSLFNLKDLKTYSSSYNTRLAIILKELDIEQITMHKLRHTQASLLIAKDVPLELIAKRLGHTDTLMIRRVYGHLLKETEDKGNRMIVGFL